MKWGEDRPACALASATWRRRPLRWQLLPGKLWRCLGASRGSIPNTCFYTCSSGHRLTLQIAEYRAPNA